MNYPLIDAEKEVLSLLKKSLAKLNYKYEARIEIPPENMGDFSFPCFLLAPIVKKSPNMISKEIKDNIGKSKWIEKVEAKGAYVNFYLDKNNLKILTMKSIFEKNEDYGHLDKKKEKVIVEHTSANPNGPLHVGRARNPIIGDTIVRIYRAAGYNVESQFYLDDMGKQVAILAWGANNKEISEEVNQFFDINGFYPGGSRIFKNKSDHQRVGYYQIASNRMKEDDKTLDGINGLVKKSESGEYEVIKLIHKAYNPVLEGITESLKRINITVDKFVPESNFVKDKSVDTVIEKLKKSKYCGTEEGAFYLDMEPFGIQGRNTKFVFVRKDGTTLYATRDIAYHLWKAENADILINILGEDHKLESKQVEICLNLIQAKIIPKVIFYSFVSLPGGKMSTRQGRVVFLDDLIDECVNRAYDEVKNRRGKDLSENKMKEIAKIIGIGALRYNIIKVQPEKDINFKWEDALNFEGNSAPFIQYAYARASGIISKINNFNNKTDINFSILNHNSEYNLIKNIAEFPIIIDKSCKQNKPHILANYLFNLASNFNQFYRDCQVISENNIELKNARIILVNGVKIVIENGLNLLGIDAPEEM